MDAARFRPAHSAWLCNVPCCKHDNDGRGLISGIAAQADSDSAIIAAKAEAERIRIEAEATAEANRIITESLNESVLKYKTIEKWDGQLPRVSLGEGAAPLIEVPVE